MVALGWSIRTQGMLRTMLTMRCSDAVMRPSHQRVLVDRPSCCWSIGIHSSLLLLPLLLSHSVTTPDALTINGSIVRVRG